MASSQFPNEDPQKASTFFVHDRNLQAHMMCFLDAQSTGRASQVCKLWRRNVLSAIKQVQYSWKERQTPELLSRHLFHPLTTFRLFEELSLQTPAKAINYGAATEDLTEVPEMVTDFVEQVSQSPMLSRLLCNATLMLDPGKDFRKVCLMARIVGNPRSTDLKASLLSKVGQTNFVAHDPKSVQRFKKIITQPENAQKLQMELMSTKLLALSEGDNNNILHNNGTTAKTALIYFTWFSNGFSNAKFLMKNPNQPLWACYTDHENALLSYSYALEIISGGCRGYEGLQNTAAFIDYIRTLFPKNNQLSIDMLLEYASDYSGYVGETSNKLRQINQILEGINASSNLYCLSNAQEALTDSSIIELAFKKDEEVWKNYDNIIKTLEENLAKSGPNSPERAFILYRIADSIISFNDEKNMAKASAYLTEVLSRLAASGSYIEVILNDNHRTSAEVVTLKEVTTLLTAQAIYLGKFNEAIEWINKGRGLTTDLSLFYAIKKQMNNPDFPDKLVKKIGNSLANWTILTYTANALTQSALTKNKGIMVTVKELLNEEFVNKFWKHHPIIRAKWLKFLTSESNR